MRLKFAATGGGNFVRVWCTDAPPDSDLKTQLTKLGASRVKVFEGDVSSDAEKGTAFEFQPDNGGKYVLTAQEYTRGASSYGGGYAGDPNGYASETAIGSETSVSVVVGDRHEITMGVAPNTATLVLYVWDDRARRTAFDLHGETTPAIINPSSPKAATAAADATIVAAALALADATSGTLVSTIIGVPSSSLTNLITKFNAHLTQGGVHASSDSDNSIAASFKSPTSPQAIARSAAEVLRKLDRHMRNDSGSGTGSASSVYHSASADWTNLLQVLSAGDLGASLVATAEAWRAYEAHRMSTVHAASDTTNTLTALSPLLDLHRAFMDVLAQSNPTTPATQNSGTTRLLHSAGSKLT